jgi:hypothetical protein
LISAENFTYKNKKKIESLKLYQNYQFVWILDYLRDLSEVPNIQYGSHHRTLKNCYVVIDLNDFNSCTTVIFKNFSTWTTRYVFSLMNLIIQSTIDKSKVHCDKIRTWEIYMIDWCLTSTLAIFQLYRGMRNFQVYVWK